jgi:hypothetical protein
MSLKDQALSASFAAKMCKFQRLDRSLAREAEVAHNTASGLAKVTRNLFLGCDQPLKNVLATIENVREVHERYSVPWFPARAIKITAYPIHRDRTKDAINKFDVALQEFHDAFPSMVERGLVNSNGLADRSEYGLQTDIYDNFSVTITYGQLTDASDWLKTTLITPEEAAELVKQSQASEQQLLSGVSDKIKDQLASVLKAARENLSKRTAPQAGVKQRFNTSWLTNLQQLAEMLPAFNLMNDPTIPAMLTDLAPILKHTTDTMKTSALAQADAATCIETFIVTYDAWLNS